MDFGSLAGGAMNTQVFVAPFFVLSGALARRACAGAYFGAHERYSFMSSDPSSTHTPERSGSIDASNVDTLVRQLLETVKTLTKDLPPARVEQILTASEMLAVTALHAQSASDEALNALNRSTRPFETDPLTGLPNRVLFRDRFSQALAHAKRRGGRVAVLFVDLDGFKAINDCYGHAVGDELLRHVARCLKAAGRDVDTVSRHGGDEFLVLLSEVANAGNAATFADKALKALSEPIRVGAEVMRVGASIGISLYPEDGEEQETLVRKADAAMYVAKRNHTAYAFASAARAVTPVRTPVLRGGADHADGLLETALDESRRTVADLTAVNERLTLSIKATEEARRAAEASAKQQAELLNVVAHELRNSLSPLQSASDVIALVGTDASLMPRLELILRRQISHITRLLTDLLEVSRLNNSRLALQLRTVELVDLVRDVANSRGPVFERRRQSLQQNIAAQSLDVSGDPVRLRQLLETLFDGASAMAPEGNTMFLHVRSSGVWLRLDLSADPAVADAPDFSDAGKELTEVASELSVGDGTGLSLLVVSELARSHGGSLRATQHVATMGWSFQLTLPLVS